MPIKLTGEAEEILRRFYDRPAMSRDQRQNYRDLELAYNRFLRIFMLSVQNVLNALSPENVDDISLVISYVCESLHWARRSLTGPRTPGYATVNYTLGQSDKSAIREAYDLVLFRLTSYCPQGMFLDNALIRLSGAYGLASGLIGVAEAIAFTRTKRDVVQRKKT